MKKWMNIARLLLLMFPVAVQAEDYTYTVSSDNTITITGYTGTNTAVVIPGTITGLAVTSIGSDAFYDCDSLTSVTIPASVTSIGSDAFSNCGNLASVIIPTNVTSIGTAAFFACGKLTGMTIPASVTSIGSRAFSSCNKLTAITVDEDNPSYSSPGGVLFNKGQTTLVAYPGGQAGSYAIPAGVTNIESYAFYYCMSMTSIMIPTNVTSIGSSAFYSCDSLTGMTIPASVTSIGSRAFSSCDKLTAITVDEDNPFYSSLSGVLFNKGQTTLVICPGGQTGSYAIPTSVTNIESYAFYFCTSMTSIMIPTNVTSIGSATFFVCSSLPSVTIPASVTSIGSRAFSSCDKLTAITVDEDNPSYSSLDGVLFNKGQTTLIACPGGRAGNYAIPAGVTSIGSEAFSNCDRLTGVQIPSSVTSIGSSAFSSCGGLTGMTIPANVTSIGSRVFSFCTKLTAITVDGNNPAYSSLGGILFNKDQTTLVVCPGGLAGSYAIPFGVISIGSDAFYSCDRLTSVTISASITSIGSWAFSSCGGLTVVAIPSSVTSIGDRAFSYCNKLVAVYCNGNAPDVYAATFNSSTNVTVYRTADTTGWPPIPDRWAGRPTALWSPNSDTDADGLPAAWEVQYFGGTTNANPNAGCSNGMNTVREAYIAGINPTDPQSVLSVTCTLLSNGQKRLSWFGVRGRNYTFLYSESLTSDDWQAYPFEVSGSDSAISFLDTSTLLSRFYRVEVRLAD